MRHMGILAAIALAISLIACGGSTNSQNTTNPGTGAWSATLATQSDQQLGTFSFNMMQNNTALTGSNMNFGNMGDLRPCFGSGTVMSGQMGPGMMNGGDMKMTMSWTSPGGTSTNTLMLQGTMAMGMGSGNGTFTLTGNTMGCTSQNGTYKMTRTGGMM